MINLQNYLIVEDTPQFNLSIKLVIPSGCNMRCPFCFNNLNRSTACHNIDDFKENFMPSLLNIVNVSKRINPNRTISLDITGNEPTFNVSLLRFVLRSIRKNKVSFDKVVLTTNGYQLDNVMEDMNGVVDIVNISVHHYNERKRSEAFGRSEMVSDTNYYKHLTEQLKNNGISVSAIAVIYKSLDEPIEQFIHKFVTWCKNVGFESLRVRSNFYAQDSFFVNYLNALDGTTVVTKGLAFKNFKHDDFDVTFFMGVESLIPYVVGVEAVVDDNGLPYLDYGKQYPLIEDYIKHVYVSFP